MKGASLGRSLWFLVKLGSLQTLEVVLTQALLEENPDLGPEGLGCTVQHLTGFF